MDLSSLPVDVPKNRLQTKLITNNKLISLAELLSAGKQVLLMQVKITLFLAMRRRSFADNVLLASFRHNYTAIRRPYFFFRLIAG